MSQKTGFVFRFLVSVLFFKFVLLRQSLIVKSKNFILRCSYFCLVNKNYVPYA